MAEKGRTGFMLLLICCMLQCRNPFGPLEKPMETVEQHTTGQRSTPSGLITQLIESYETRQIDLFQDLLPRDGSFQFFIARDYFDEYKTKFKELTEARDERLLYIGESPEYIYWTQDAEIERHERLFRYADIEFISKPGLESIRRFIDNGDSLAELKVTGGMFLISHFEGDTVYQYPVKIDKQVFLILKDIENLWVIRKWYDFSSETEL